MIIHKNGYYISEPFKDSDWHAGFKFESEEYRILIFLDNSKLVRNSTTNPNAFDMKKCISESDSNNIYKIIDHILEIQIEPHSRFSKKRAFTIRSSEVLVDENLIEYRFVPVLP